MLQTRYLAHLLINSRSLLPAKLGYQHSLQLELPFTTKYLQLVRK